MPSMIQSPVTGLLPRPTYTFPIVNDSSYMSARTSTCTYMPGLFVCPLTNCRGPLTLLSLGLHWVLLLDLRVVSLEFNDLFASSENFYTPQRLHYVHWNIASSKCSEKADLMLRHKCVDSFSRATSSRVDSSSDAFSSRVVCCVSLLYAARISSTDAL